LGEWEMHPESAGEPVEVPDRSRKKLVEPVAPHHKGANLGEICMSILGVESVLFGVDDLAQNAKFWSDFGLPVESVTETEAVFRLASGSRVILLPHGDARLPSPDPFPGNGVKETIWGVDTAENLEKIAASLASEVAVTRDADGTVHCVCPDGQP
ncbi:hypothetical protein E4T56_gene17875, partial [Termitomyces sp. T112]